MASSGSGRSRPPLFRTSERRQKVAAKLEIAGVEAAQEPPGRLLRALAFQPEDELVAGALEGDARPAAASDLLEDEAGEVHEVHDVQANRLQESRGGIVQRRRRLDGGDSPASRSILSM